MSVQNTKISFRRKESVYQAKKSHPVGRSNSKVKLMISTMDRQNQQQQQHETQEHTAQIQKNPSHLQQQMTQQQQKLAQLQHHLTQQQKYLTLQRAQLKAEEEAKSLSRYNESLLIRSKTLGAGSYSDHTFTVF